MLIGWVTALFAIAGALVYALAANPKVAEIGRVTFFAAMIALMIALSGHVARIG